MKNVMELLCGGEFMPHGQCYLWTPELIWLHALSDALIAVAYVAISLGLIYFVRRRKDLPYTWIFLMFGAFIVSCALTHAFEVWTIWNSNYYLTGSVKAFTALVSVATAVGLLRILPQAMQLTGPQQLRELNESLESRVKERTMDLEETNHRLRNQIEERERAEAEVKRLNELLQRRVNELQVLFDVLPVGVGISEDAECRFIRTNAEFARMLGLPRGANASLTAPAHEAPQNFRVVRQGRPLGQEELPMQTCARENRPIFGFDETLERADGTKIEVLCNAVPLRDPDGRVGGCVATFQDVTQLNAALVANARYAAIVASSEDAIIGRSSEGIVTEWNHGAEKVFGYKATEIIGQSISILMPEERLNEEDPVLAGIHRGETVAPFETVRRKKDGSLVDVSITLSPILDVNGNIVGIAKLARDITERLQAEHRRDAMDKKIQETQKLESLGVLAGGIAHDFNNLLTGILGNASLAGMALPPNSSVLNYLKQIETASCRAAELCSQMLTYSGRGQFTFRNLDVNQLVSETTHLLSISITKTAVLRLNLSQVLPPVKADATQLRQIIMNLVINASEAIGARSGVIAVTTGVLRIDKEYLATLRLNEELPLGDYVFIEVSDNGCGMDEGTLSKIFDPFFTTKFTGRGLGLAAVLGIARRHKGGMKVYSEPGRGTTFKLLLPAVTGSMDAMVGKAARSPQEGVRGSGCVLVVDDEETVRTVAARMLEKIGYTVELANDGRAAVELFRADPARYRLVLLDLTMPHLNGEETFRQLRHIRPGVRVVLMSGFNEHDVITSFTGKGLAGFIQKPFNAPAFETSIRGFIRMD